jgi:hypothetical protein
MATFGYWLLERLRVFKIDRADTFLSRMTRAKNEGYLCGSREAKLFTLVVGNAFTRERAMDWLDSTVDEGRVVLECQHATEREIEAWDMSCRIGFLVEIAVADERARDRGKI